MSEKRIGDKKEKFLVAKMTERQKKIAQFKGHKTGQSVDNFVIAAVDQLDEKTYLENNACPECGTKKVKTEQPFIYRHGNQEIKVVNYFKTSCDCKKDKSDFYAENYLEDLVEFEVMQLEKEGKEIPSEMDLDDLLRMDE